MFDLCSNTVLCIEKQCTLFGDSKDDEY